MWRVLPISLLLVVFPLGLALGQEAVPKDKDKEIVKIRGKEMGYISVSPDLQQEIEAKAGKGDQVPSEKGNANTYVGKHGFVYVSEQAEAEKQKR